MRIATRLRVRCFRAPQAFSDPLEREAQHDRAAEKTKEEI
jgi:hypothetical protein